MELDRRDFLKPSGTAVVAAVALSALPELPAMAAREFPGGASSPNYPKCSGRIQSFAPKNAILVDYLTACLSQGQIFTDEG